jgi:hypothetical protein
MTITVSWRDGAARPDACAAWPMGKKLTLAMLLAVLPTLIGVLGVVAFGISVAIYGF